MSNLTNLRAIEAGIDNIGTSISSMSMGYGHSATETMVHLMEERNKYKNKLGRFNCSNYFKYKRKYENLKEV